MLPNKYLAFSLLELLVTLSIASILLTLTMVSYQQFFAAQQADSVINQLFHALNLARSEAIKWQTTVTVCPTVDRIHCGGMWHSGYMIFTDYAHNATINGDDKLLQVVTISQNIGKLTWSGFPAVNYIQFAANGFIRAQNGTFSYCVKNGKKELLRSLIINKSGRMRIIKGEARCGE